MKYFTINELCWSETASKYKIKNTPTEEIKEHLSELVENVLDPLREAWGGPIIVSSGYRCPELNKKVGGSKTSSHMSGYAVDLVPENGEIERFFNFVKNSFLLKESYEFDQLIDEHSGKNHWVHIGYKNNKGEQRRQIKKYEDGKYYILISDEEENNETIKE